MACAFFSLLALNAGLAALVWLGGRRVAAHLRKKPEARLLVQHVLAALLLGEEEKKAGTPEPKPEAKKIKGTLV